ncbi:MAG: SDR family oxidoreductase [Pseudomonadota bacterium]
MNTTTDDKKTALVTGASSGIGAEFARLFAADGVGLVLVARNRDRLDAFAGQLRNRHGIDVMTIAADLSEPETPASVHAAVAAAGIAVDYLVNNAGVGVQGGFRDTRLEDELAMMRLNTAAVVHLTKLFLPGMLMRQSGRILNVASLAALQPGGPGAAVYYASKAFVLSFSRGLGAELRGSRVSVTALCPGPVDTRFQEAGDFARTLLYRSFMTSRAEAVAKAGYRAMQRGRMVCVPGPLAKLLAFGGQMAPGRVALAINAMLLKARG